MDRVSPTRDAITRLFDIMILMTAPYAVLKARRESRKGNQYLYTLILDDLLPSSIFFDAESRDLKKQLLQSAFCHTDLQLHKNLSFVVRKKEPDHTETEHGNSRVGTRFRYGNYPVPITLYRITLKRNRIRPRGRRLVGRPTRIFRQLCMACLCTPPPAPLSKQWRVDSFETDRRVEVHEFRGSEAVEGWFWRLYTWSLFEKGCADDQRSIVNKYSWLPLNV